MNNYAIICSGQGGLGVDVFDFSKQHEAGKSAIDVFSNQFGWNLISVETGGLKLGLNTYSQPLTVASSIANWEVIKSHLPPPALIAGYSAGEVAALGCTDSLDLYQIAELSYLRCAAMDRFSPNDSGMVAVKGLSRFNLTNLLTGTKIYIAIFNEDDHFIIGGKNLELDAFQQLLQERGIWSKSLAVSVPSHTPLLLGASNQFLSDIKSMPYGDFLLNIPVTQGISGKLNRSLSGAIVSIGHAISEPINWQLCMQTIMDLGIKVVLELGPGNSLAKMIAEIYPSVSARSVTDFRTPEGLQTWLLRELEY